MLLCGCQLIPKGFVPIKMLNRWICDAKQFLFYKTENPQALNLSKLKYEKREILNSNEFHN